MSKPIEELNSPGELRDHLISKATNDSEFRASLVADPKAAVNAELGVNIPDGVAVSVYEDSATAVHLVLPPNEELATETLEEIAGGTTYCDSNRRGCY